MLTFIKKTRKRYTPSGSSRQMALYRCSCGNTKEICMRNVRKGIAKSCGCLNKQQIRKLAKIKGKRRWNYKHGMFGTRFYNIYYSIKARCNPNSTSNSKYYSDKGVKLLWQTFYDFKNDMYESYLEHCKKFGTKQTTIDRLDSSKHYCKENCRWATLKEQAKEKVGKAYLADNLKEVNRKRFKKLEERNKRIIALLEKMNWKYGSQIKVARKLNLSENQVSFIVKTHRLK